MLSGICAQQQHKLCLCVCLLNSISQAQTSYGLQAENPHCQNLLRWLAKDEDDGAIRRRLSVSAPGAAVTSYRLVTFTSDIRGAGTDAGVWIEMIGALDGKQLQVSHKVQASTSKWE